MSKPRAPKDTPGPRHTTAPESAFSDKAFSGGKRGRIKEGEHLSPKTEWKPGHKPVNHGEGWAAMKMAARIVGVEAIETLVIIMRECRRNPATNEMEDFIVQPEVIRASGAAAAVILDRGFGKAEQPLKIDDEDDKLARVAAMLLEAPREKDE